MGYRKLWKFSQDVHVGGPGDISNGGNFKGASWDWSPWFKPEAIQNFKFKICAFKTKDAGGKFYAAKLTLNFLSSEYKEPHSPKIFDFNRYNNGSSTKTAYDNSEGNNHKFGGFKDYSDDDDDNPIQTDSNFLFSNGDSIVFDINKKDDDKT